jgi:hypothetical protein
LGTYVRTDFLIGQIPIKTNRAVFISVVGLAIIPAENRGAFWPEFSCCGRFHPSLILAGVEVGCEIHIRRFLR